MMARAKNPKPKNGFFPISQPKVFAAHGPMTVRIANRITTGGIGRRITTAVSFIDLRIEFDIRLWNVSLGLNQIVSEDVFVQLRGQLRILALYCCVLGESRMSITNGKVGYSEIEVGDGGFR